MVSDSDGDKCGDIENLFQNIKSVLPFKLQIH